MPILILHPGEESIATASFKDDSNNPVIPIEEPTWETTDEEIVTVEPADDGLSATLHAVGPVGTAQVYVADGDIVETVDVEVVAGKPGYCVVTLSKPERRGD